MPDQLLRRVKKVGLERNMSFRAMVIDALERTLEEPSVGFRLRDASVGTKARAINKVSAEAINRAIDNQRDSPFPP